MQRASGIHQRQHARALMQKWLTPRLNRRHSKFTTASRMEHFAHAVDFRAAIIRSAVTGEGVAHGLDPTSDGRMARRRRVAALFKKHGPIDDRERLPASPCSDKDEPGEFEKNTAPTPGPRVRSSTTR